MYVVTSDNFRGYVAWLFRMGLYETHDMLIGIILFESRKKG